MKNIPESTLNRGEMTRIICVYCQKIPYHIRKSWSNLMLIQETTGATAENE